jgi:hypothetical protein
MGNSRVPSQQRGWTKTKNKWSSYFPYNTADWSPTSFRWPHQYAYWLEGICCISQWGNSIIVVQIFSLSVGKIVKEKKFIQFFQQQRVFDFAKHQSSRFVPVRGIRVWEVLPVWHFLQQPTNWREKKGALPRVYGRNSCIAIPVAEGEERIRPTHSRSAENSQENATAIFGWVAGHRRGWCEYSKKIVRKTDQQWVSPPYDN